MDNYFCGFSDTMNTQGQDVWEGEYSRDSLPQIKISGSKCEPFKAPTNKKEKDSNSSLNDSPKNSEISVDSLDSVKHINKEDNSEELDNISAKLRERITVMKAAKKEKERENRKSKPNKESEKIGSYDNSSFNPSPNNKHPMKLQTVNEQDEINHRKVLKHKRAHSSSSSGHNKVEYIQLVENLKAQQKEKELGMLNNFKVILRLTIF